MPSSRPTWFGPSSVRVETILDPHPIEPATESPGPSQIPRSKRNGKHLLATRAAPEWVIEKAATYVLPISILGPRHYHPNTFQVLKVLEGKGELRIGPFRYPAGQGGIFWIPPKVRHSSVEPTRQLSRLIELFFRRNRSASCPVAIRNFPCHISTDDNPEVLVCFHEIIKEFAQRKWLWEWTASALLNHLIVLLARSIETQADSGGSTRVAGYRIDREGVARGMNHIVQNYYQPIDLKLLARVAGMSVNRFSKVFQAIEGTTPIDFLIDYRLKRASELIATKTLKLTKIAEAVGFGSVHYFSRCYKQRLGVSPSRQRHSLGDPTDPKKAPR